MTPSSFSRSEFPEILICEQSQVFLSCWGIGQIRHGGLIDYAAEKIPPTRGVFIDKALKGA